MWRDLFDIGVLWRQISEPFDPVWWIDRLTPQSYADGFGLQTPMVRCWAPAALPEALPHPRPASNIRAPALFAVPPVPQIAGQMQVPRYYSMFPRAFAIMKRLTAEQCPLTDDLREQVLASKSVEELYGVMKRDFWCGGHAARPGTTCVRPDLTLCVRVAAQGRVPLPLCGVAWARHGGHAPDDSGALVRAKSRAASRSYLAWSCPVQYAAPEGHEFTIRTPGTPARCVGRSCVRLLAAAVRC